MDCIDGDAPPPGAARGRLLLADRAHPSRPRLERWIEARFAAAFDAQLTAHLPLVAALLDGDDAPVAVAGVRFPEREGLFLERYLDEPVEQALARAFARPVTRSSVVEIGSLASQAPEATLRLFGELAAWLSSACGRRYAVATARPELQRALARAGFGLCALATAEPGRLGDDARLWGRYYDRAPAVVAGEIGASQALPLLRRRLRARLMAREVRRLRSAAP